MYKEKKKKSLQDAFYTVLGDSGRNGNIREKCKIIMCCLYQNLTFF